MPYFQRMPEGYRRCTYCREILSAESFNTNPLREKTDRNFHPYCRECQREHPMWKGTPAVSKEQAGTTAGVASLPPKSLALTPKPGRANCAPQA
jgi:hypothetical protein